MDNTMKHFTTLILIIMSPLFAAAQNIDLATVPSRDSVQLTIYNAEDITLVRETRVMTFAKGINTLKFSWANTLIDPTSVRLAMLTKQDQLSTIDTVYPHERNQELNWRVESEIDGEATVEISYFTSGITWSADYAVTVDQDQFHAKFLSYVTVTNNSGEDYEDAQVRLVVGKVNLVERIAQLARKGWQPAMPTISEAPKRQLNRARKSQAMAGAMLMAESRMVADDAAEIVREGLSEYFIFIVSGTQTVPNQWSKQMLSFEVPKAPVKIEYRFWPQTYGHRLTKLLLLTNDSESGMGDAPLPDGTVQCYQHNGLGGLRYLGQTHTNYIAISDKFELNLGKDPSVSLEWTPQQVKRRNIWATNKSRKIRQLDGQMQQRDDTGQVVGWTEDTLFAQTVHNDTGSDITINIRRRLNGHVSIQSPTPMARHDAYTVQMVFELEPSVENVSNFLVTQEHGRNSKQNKLEIKQAQAAFN